MYSDVLKNIKVQVKTTVATFWAIWGNSLLHLITLMQPYSIIRLMKDQKSTLIQEMKKSLEDIRKKEGLEKAIKDFMRNPAMGVPVEMRFPCHHDGLHCSLPLCFLLAEPS